MIMTNTERINHLRDMLKEATSYLDHSVQQDGAPDEVYMRDVESLAVAIRALEAQDTSALERPMARKIKLLDAILDVIANMSCESDRPMFAAILDYWQEERQAQTQIERIALDDYRKDMLSCVCPHNLNIRRELTARTALLLLEYVHPEQKAAEPGTPDNLLSY